MADTLPKGYEPHDVEARWRKHWEDDKTFTPDPDAPGEPYSIVIPPPNVTGALHIGHALNHTLIDVLCRHARQKGKNVLWVPGTDHAGIATQNVVERALAKEGKSRKDLGREAFIDRVWEWRDEYGHRILDQARALGDSVDWTRLRFTMDEGLSAAVRKVFVRLYNDGLIYKGDYIINWCSRCHTALADDEVEHEQSRGKLWKVRYLLADGSGHITIATTRPETIPGDTAICVHPEDERYVGLIGKNAVVPVLGREIPIIADAYVDREFGTGALKVTPCHDHNDWMLGKKHDLVFLKAIDENGVMTAEAGAYQGLAKEECRTRIVADIEAAGLMDHPLWKHFDLLFKNFNSATSYSGPAAIRLLRASCGQEAHADLYKSAPQQCHLFSQLASAGYTVDGSPSAGSVIVFQPGVLGASADYGHVAMVEEVRGDGSILISESNALGLGVVSTREISASQLAAAGSGVRYIH